MWQEAELSLRTFAVENIFDGYIHILYSNGFFTGQKILLEANSIHQARIIKNGKIEII